MRAPILAALSLVACAPEDGRADSVPVHSLEGLRPHSDVVLDAVAEILGLDLEETDARPAGAVVLVRIDSPVSGWDAHSDWVAACSPIAWAPDASYVLAHEVGHTLGLEHSSDPANLMYPAPGYELDDEQVDTLRLGAWRLLHECP